MYICMYVYNIYNPLQPADAPREPSKRYPTLPNLGRGRKGNLSLCRYVDMYVYIYNLLH